MSAGAAQGKPGIFIPYRHAKSVRPVAGGYPAIGALFDASRDAFLQTIDAIDRQRAALKAIPAEALAPAARWNQDWFPRLDAAVAYALVRERRPGLIVEILSPSEGRKRKEEKMEDYASIRVPEVWLCSPEAQSIEVRRLSSSGRLERTAVVVDGTLEPAHFPGVKIAVPEIWPVE